MDEENSPEELSGIEERWGEISKLIEDYLTRVGAKSKKPQKVEEILSLSYDDIKTMSAEECGENSFILSQFAFYLQQEYNFHKSKVDWCDLTLTYMTSNYGEQSTFIKKDEKAVKLAYKNPPMKKLMKMMGVAKTIVLNLEGISFKVSAMSSSLESLQQSKRKGKYV